MPYDPIDDKFQLEVQERVVIPKFYKKVWGESVSIESVDKNNTDLGKLLDKLGVDKIVQTNNGSYSISQRIQRKKFADWTEENLGSRSLTIRDTRYYSNGKTYLSELHKDIEAIKNKSICANYKSHCYANADTWEEVTDLESSIIVDLEGLYNFMDLFPHLVYKSRQDLSETFIFVLFDDIRRLMPKIIIKNYPFEKREIKGPLDEFLKSKLEA